MPLSTKPDIIVDAFLCSNLRTTSLDIPFQHYLNSSNILARHNIVKYKTFSGSGVHLSMFVLYI